MMTSPWTRRAKVPLPSLAPATVAAWERSNTQVLEARVAGTDKKGAPVCATVPLLDGGWRLVPGDAATS